MPIHSKEEIFSNRDDEVFGTGFLPHPLPKYKLPKHESDPTAAYQLVHDELLLDGNSRQNVATFCQTWVEPEIRKLMDECLDKNMIDKDEYPQMAELEFDRQSASYTQLVVAYSAPLCLTSKSASELKRVSLHCQNQILSRRLLRLSRSAG